MAIGLLVRRRAGSLRRESISSIPLGRSPELSCAFNGAGRSATGNLGRAESCSLGSPISKRSQDVIWRKRLNRICRGKSFTGFSATACRDFQKFQFSLLRNSVEFVSRLFDPSWMFDHRLGHQMNEQRHLFEISIRDAVTDRGNHSCGSFNRL